MYSSAAKARMLLTATDATAGVLSLQAPIDDKTKYLLLAAVALLGGAGTLAAGRAAVTAVQSRLQGAVSQGAETAQKLVILAGFWVAVFFAARAILEL